MRRSLYFKSMKVILSAYRDISKKSCLLMQATTTTSDYGGKTWTIGFA